MDLSKSELAALLSDKLGFIEGKRTDRQFYELWVEGKKVAQTYLPFSKMEHVHDKLLRKIACLIGLKLSEFKLIIDCTLTRDDYLNLLGGKQ